MRISNKRVTEVYEAIHDPIMSLRIELEQGKTIITESVLFDLEQAIWQKVAGALGIEPA